MNVRNLSLGLLSACIAALGACNQPKNNTATTTKMTDSITYGQLVPDSAFEKTIDGKQIHLYSLKNKSGMVATLTNYGGHLVNLLVPDSAGKMIDVSVGLGNIDGYVKTSGSFYGAT